MKQTLQLLRRGRPRPSTSSFPARHRTKPETHRPFQGGQQFFNDFNLRTADENAELSNAKEASSWKHAAAATFPQMDAAENRLSSEETLANELQELRRLDQWTNKRSFNQLDWFDEQRPQMMNKDGATPTILANSQSGEMDGETNVDAVAEEEEPSIIPPTVDGSAFFQNQFGYSMVKDSKLPVTMEYAQLDIWGERAKYSKDTYFLYLVSRRRNTYAVCFDFYGKKMHPVYSAGNKGLKGGDRGIRQEGGIEVAHQVTSQYLNDLIPKLREHVTSKGRSVPAKFEVVVRLLGFYNGRQGAVRAVMDRSDLFDVKFVEDVTPFPNRGPKMPKATV